MITDTDNLADLTRLVVTGNGYSIDTTVKSGTGTLSGLSLRRSKNTRLIQEELLPELVRFVLETDICRVEHIPANLLDDADRIFLAIYAELINLLQ